MKIYDWILFDADKTLFHFDDYSGLNCMFKKNFEIDFCEQDYQNFQIISKPLWTSYQNGEINAQYLQEQRFYSWAKKLQISTAQLNSIFMQTMAEISKPMQGVESLLNFLKGKAKLGIITNGFIELQQTRLERTGLKDFFEIHVISEQVGIAKPDPGIFEHALTLAGNPSRKQVLMVGDTFETDILGGISAELDTCWLNPEAILCSPNIKINYQIRSITELQDLLHGAL
ncbi:pyrimidine 5'-nucleotidase [Legionella geestiana]|uniref:pyrimidine 5'-nucleotidase n=1 Tax=Legionella geestiana TaxID=45065 RepID=UPI001C9E78A5|nr:pyrimidine 5'-nucleotidase [Legionella geestiana]